MYLLKRDSYIYLHPNGGTTVYRSVFHHDKSDPYWHALPAADAAGIHQRPEEISFYDINQ